MEYTDAVINQFIADHNPGSASFLADCVDKYSNGNVTLAELDTELTVLENYCLDLYTRNQAGTLTADEAATDIIEKVENEGHATAKRTSLTANERAEEIIMTGLRLSEGIEAHRFKSFLNNEALLRLKEGGFLILEKGILRTTDTGQLCLNSVLGELLST